MPSSLASQTPLTQKAFEFIEGSGSRDYMPSGEKRTNNFFNALDNYLWSAYQLNLGEVSSSFHQPPPLTSTAGAASLNHALE